MMQRRHVLALIVGTVVFVAATAPAHARCRWTWDCTSQPCRQVQLCDNATDVPAIRPTEVAPVPPTSLAPITTPVNPPTGTNECRNANLCDYAGQCRWQTVCR
jgi:hypothetical protein